MANSGNSWPARAKINLFLHVTGRRPDGYHCLESLVVFADLADLIEIESSNDLSLTIRGPFAAGLPADQGNLVLQAALLLAKDTGSVPRGRIILTKNLPVAAGIGGGSADAAATLLALRSLWQVAMGDAALRDLAAELGADVPVCLGSRPARISGIGHDLAGVGELPSCALLLVNPNQAVHTADVFAHLQPPYATPHCLDRCWPTVTGATMTEVLTRTRNDLEPAARTLAPVIGEVLADISALRHCRLARMSGSGATCFGLFDDLSAARTAGGELAARRPDWWVEPSSIQGSMRSWGR
ncbi:MAG: 4-(cytidine 5'-diphospho)-2-C-methyl-D-erythritol kinase [Alphaproteobacteria bacterium]|jgi:4-diphosphocytidyl-2-C-methyl-D-erythritol kinase